LVISAIILGYGLYGAVLSFLLVRVLTFFILFAYILAKFGIKIPDFSLIKKYLSFGLPKIADSVSYWAITSIDRYFIGFFWGMVFVGYYAPAYSIGTVLTLFLFPISFMLSATLPKSFDEDKIEEVKEYLSLSLKYFLSIIIPASFGLSVLSRQLLSIFSTEEIANAAHTVTPVIVASIFLYGITYFFVQILVLAKKTKTIAKIWAVGAALNFLLNMIFVPLSGIMGAAFATLTAYLCAFILMRHFADLELKFYIDWSFVAKSTFSSLMMALLIFLFGQEGIFGLIFSITFGVLFYGISMFLLKGFSKKEIIFLKNLSYEMVFFNK
jgi:O-antigen/teichoic acid export membrane protein